MAELPEDEIRSALHRAADLAADYLVGVGDLPVTPSVVPGEIGALLPDEPPLDGEPMERILDDWKSLIVPGLTHWNHPRFFAYFAITGSAPGVAAETLAAAANVNAMLWRTSPVATELEERACDWLRRMVGLPEGFRGHINDTASIASLLALAAARHRLPGLDIRRRGLSGATAAPVVYASDQAHSSIDKAVLTLGLGLDHLRRLPSDERFRLRPEALERAVAEDRAAGRAPMAVVATAGTTSTTSVDPVEAIAEIAAREGLWLHVDAAYAGCAAVCPELRATMAGWERADSIVLNPHKWLFTPVDCSVLFVRDLDGWRDTFSVVPEYLRSWDDSVQLMDLGVQLGRRFRALKLWMVIRAYGVEAIRGAIREHCRLARSLAERIDAEPGFEVVAPVPFSTVCFRATPGGSAQEEDRFNERLLERVNASRRVFLSHTRLPSGLSQEGAPPDRFVLRLAVGNLKTTEDDVEEAWTSILRAARALT